MDKFDKFCFLVTLNCNQFLSPTGSPSPKGDIGLPPVRPCVRPSVRPCARLQQRPLMLESCNFGTPSTSLTHPDVFFYLYRKNSKWPTYEQQMSKNEHFLSKMCVTSHSQNYYKIQNGRLISFLET